jgi:hypothetical protein
MSKKAKNPTGTVLECCPNLIYKVEMDDGQVLLAYMAGKMKIRKIKQVTRTYKKRERCKRDGIREFKNRARPI